MFQSLGEYDKAKKYLEKALAINIEIGDSKEKATCYGKLGTVFQSLCEFERAKEYHEKALAITTEFDDRATEATCYGNLGVVFQSLAEYNKAKEYIEKALAIKIEIGDRKGEATDFANLGIVFHSLGKYQECTECLEKALAIQIEVGDRKGEATCYGNLGMVSHSLGEYDKAKEYFEKTLAISIKIGDRAGEATCYGNLGGVFQSLGEYGKAKEYRFEALAIRLEIGDRRGEAIDYMNLGTVFQLLSELEKSKEYLERGLVIFIEIGEREGEAATYDNLGVVLVSLGEYDKAKEYMERALVITKEIGDRAGEASCYGNLGNVFQHVDDYDKAKEYYEKALAIRREIGDREGEAADCINLATKFADRGEYEKAKEHLDTALAITVEIGDKAGEASCYGNLGTVFQILGEYDKARQYFQKGLVIRKGIGYREGEAAIYFNLGTLFHCIGEPVLAQDYLYKALSISQDIGDLAKEFACVCELTIVKIAQRKIQEAFDCLVLSMEKSESLRGFLRDNDQFKISFSDVHSFPYRNLAALHVFSGNPNKALYVTELARARALADLMATRYSVERQNSIDPQSLIGIESIMKHESNCSCLYIFSHGKKIFLWILKTSGVMHFRAITVNESGSAAGFSGSLDELFATSFRSFGILPREDCEDRSLNDIEPNLDSSKEQEHLRQSSDEDDTKLRLALLYNMFIAPVADLLEGSVIIIVPDRHLYRVPFPALLDGSGMYLSETFRIHIIPSLTILKFIQDSPTDHHSQTGALIVGDPDVGKVSFKGRRKTFKELPFARREAEMIGRLLGVQPLLGKGATKQAVLEGLHSAGLIHFAAHGDAERGEIALSPVRCTGKLPKEQDYLLTMSDISQVPLRAKLVVLSCCHSARGQIRAEGVVGIARAFLGSGARSVLVALWALDDEATEQFMSRFYEHLVGGESASESLQEAMKWMRTNGWSEVKQWAPFMLIGDNVSFEFRK